MNIEAFPAPFTSLILAADSFPVFSTHFSFLNLIEINPLCHPNQRAPSVKEETSVGKRRRAGMQSRERTEAVFLDHIVARGWESQGPWLRVLPSAAAVHMSVTL